MHKMLSYCAFIMKTPHKFHKKVPIVIMFSVIFAGISPTLSLSMRFMMIYLQFMSILAIRSYSTTGNGFDIVLSLK